MHIFKIITTVCTKMLLAVGSLGDDVHNQVLHRPFVMFVGAGNPDCQGSAYLIDKQMDFATQFTAIRWVFACFCTSQRSWAHHAVDRLPFPMDPTFTGIILDDGFEQFFKQTLCLPGLKPLMQHTTGGAKPFFFNG